MSSDERVPVSLEDALKRIGDAEEIHTFRAAGPALIGAHWSREQLIDAMTKWGVEESGPAASAAKHTLCLIDDKGPLFIEAARDQE